MASRELEGPLGGVRVAVPVDAAAGEVAARLLRRLGATAVPGGDELNLPETDPAIEWAQCGAMSLTGPAAGPPSLAPGAPATLATAALAIIRYCAGHSADAVPDSGVLAERAALSGHTRNAPWSVGGAFRCLPALDGWVGVSLARQSDLDLLPALVEAPVDDPWTALRIWLSRTRLESATRRATLLGFPLVRVSAIPDACEPMLRPTAGPFRQHRASPLIIDLTALWAGPLCAHILGLHGARVVKVESATRLDGARRGSRTFFDLLHAGHESLVLDLQAPSGRVALAKLIDAADVVLESSRSRALEQLGISAAGFVAGGGIWLSITGYGRDDPRVGFGDDVAAAAGLVGWGRDGPYPVGDAIADPLTGLVAAAGVLSALRSGRGWLLDVSMYGVAALAAQPVHAPARASVHHRDGAWQLLVRGRRHPVAHPSARAADARAASPGEHTTAISREFAL